jgi:enoyl-[acyl-carrier-protein] reductase (NADH)
MEMISDFSRLLGVSMEEMTAQYKKFDILGSGPTLKQIGETAVFLASENGVIFNSHIVDVDCGKLNVL